MTIEPTEKEYFIIPTLSITKFENPLTKEARRSFDYEWEDFYLIYISWWKWKIFLFKFETK